MDPAANRDLLALLDDFAARGISLRVDGGQLRVRGPGHLLTDDLRSALARHKAALVELLGGEQPRGPDDLVPVPRGEDAPLSFAQQRIWFIIQLAPESNAAYNILAAVRITGPLAVDGLERALNEIISRHETLRTGFVAVAGRPVQRIAPRAALRLTREDLRDLRPEARAGEVERRLTVQAQVPFDLAQPPLVRATLFQTATDEHVLAVVLHHLVSDGWSSGVIIDELAALYAAFTAGRPSPLPPLDVQYADYVAWQRKTLTGETLQRQIDFWRRKLEGLEALDLPLDHLRPPVVTYAGSSTSFRLPTELAARLRDLGRGEEATLFQTLVAAFGVLLSRYTGQTDIGIGSTIANRGHKALEPLIGFLTNTLVLRLNLGGNPSFRELVRRVRDVAREAYEAQDLPFEKLVEELQLDRDLSHNPLFQVCLSLLQAHRDALRLGGLTLTQLDPVSPTARFDLTVTMEDTRQGLLGTFEYNTDLFERHTIARMVDHFRIVLEQVAGDPDARVADLPLLTPAERRRMLVDWTDTATAYPRDRCVHELFEEQVTRAPQAVAVRAGDETLTYAELNARANQLARYLRSRGVGPDVAVAVAAERSAAMIVALVAILKAGGCYVPFDPTDPPDRLAYTLAEVRAPVIVAPGGRHDQLPAGSATLFSLERDAAGLNGLSTGDLPNLAHPDNLVYTTYTSGSTGRPKGIAIPHRGVVRLVRNTNYLEYGPSLVILEVAPVSFDASTFEIWGALTSGAQLIVMPPDVPSLRELGEAIERHGVTTLYLTSALFSLMVDERLEAFRGVRHLLVGGDIISVPHARRVLAAHPGLTLINGYGPTETTTFASCGILRRPEDVGHSVTIGPPISNTTIYILDHRLNPTPIGVPGDLYIGGDGNARGYLNQPGLTAETFMPNPCPRQAGDRIYRTGDLARWMADGTIEFLGRRDNQVKVRGFRIELGEIENVVGAHPSVQRVVVVVEPGSAASKRLIAFLQLAPRTTDDELQWGVYLRERLPDYMVPAAFIRVNDFPLTAHNKIDRRALMARIKDALRDEHRASIAPRNPIEEALAEIWRDLLKVERVGATDSFFELGGHSLLATQIMWRIYEIFQVELPLRELFENPTVAHLASALERLDPRPGRPEALARLHLQVSRMSSEEVERMLREGGQT